MKAKKKKERIYFSDPKLDKSLKALWKALKKDSRPYTGMTTQQVLNKIRKD